MSSAKAGRMHVPVGLHRSVIDVTVMKEGIRSFAPSSITLAGNAYDLA